MRKSRLDKISEVLGNKITSVLFLASNNLGIKICLRIQESRLRTILGSVEHSGRQIFAYKDQTCTFLGVPGFEEILQKSTFFDLFKHFCPSWRFISIVLTYNHQIMIPWDA